MKKFCTKCKSWKNIGLFAKNRAQKDGLQNWCRDCRKSLYVGDYKEACKKKAKDRYWSNTEKFSVINKNLVRETKLLVINAYGGACECCGERRIEFLCVDHINGGGSAERKSGMRGAGFYRYLIKNNFPVGYRILCSNCNSSLGMYGYCPHNVSV